MADRAKSMLWAACLIALLGAAPVLAQNDVTTVGSGGELYTVEAGASQDLFPDGSMVAPNEPVLRLQVTHPDHSRDRLLVPGTETADVEDSVSLVFDDGSRTLFILWQTKINLIHSSLNLISFHDGQFSQMIEIWGSPFGSKTAPQLAVTRDRYVTENANGTTHSWARTVLHVIWAQDGQYGPDILYSPIILLDGDFVGSSPVYRLADLAQLDEGSYVGRVDPALAAAPRIQPGRNDQSVVIGFASAGTGRLVTLELETLPGEISYLADRLHALVVESGDQFPRNPSNLADSLHRKILELGASLGIHPGLAAYAADVVERDVASSNAADPVNVLADRLRRQIIEIGARMTGRGVDRTLAKTGYHVLEVDGDQSVADAGPAPNLIRISTASTRPVPPISAVDAPIRLDLSKSGDSVIVAWPEGDGLAYRESQGDDWGDRLELVVGSPSVPSLERAQQMLQQRARDQHSPIE